MAKKAVTAASAQNERTAEEILDLIDSLPRAEKCKISMLMLMRPVGKPWREALRHAAQVGIELYEQLKVFVRKAEEFLPEHERLMEVVKDAEARLGRYTRGPKAKSQRSEQRRELIRQFCEAGMTDPRKILEALRSHAPELVMVKGKPITLKTIKNDLAKL
jgi:hypothetical protein